MRHAGKVGGNGASANVLAQEDRERAGVDRQVLENIAERDFQALAIGDLHADCLLAWDRCKDSDIGGRECVGEVIF
uniref:Unannotated protein n=1 Tax=freshwater metagenome TaxID=449393 RepID=A0A6J5Z0R7_9ZZZZ